MFTYYIIFLVIILPFTRSNDYTSLLSHSSFIFFPLIPEILLPSLSANTSDVNGLGLVSFR